MQKILFIDRDGTLIEEPPTDYQIDALEKFTLVPGVISALRQIVTKTDYSLVMVFQSGRIGYSFLSRRNFHTLSKVAHRYFIR
jgi:imidazoleglycerol-phosphate dehydratase/histidinol-phosphatase